MRTFIWPMTAKELVASHCLGDAVLLVVLPGLAQHAICHGRQEYRPIPSGLALPPLRVAIPAVG
jgi:hypothetical protein